MESTIEKMKPLQDYNNLLMEYRMLQALVLQFRQKIVGASCQIDYEMFREYLDVEYDKHFNITSKRYGRTE